MQAAAALHKLHSGSFRGSRGTTKVATWTRSPSSSHLNRIAPLTRHRSSIVASASLNINALPSTQPLLSQWRQWWTFDPPNQDETPASGKLLDLAKALWKLVTPDRALLAWGSVFLVVAAGCELAIPHFISKAIFLVGSSTTKAEFRHCIACLAGVTLGYSVFAAVRGFIFSMINTRVTRRLRQKLFNTLIRQEVAFFDAQDVGSLTSRLSSDCGAIARCISININIALRSGLQFIAAAAYLFVLNPVLACSCLAASSFMWLVALIYGDFSRKVQRATQDTMAMCSSVAEESLSMSRTVRSIGTEALEEGRYAARLQQLYDLGLRQAVGYSAYVWLGHMGHHAARLTALIVGGAMALQGSITPQQLTTFVFYTESITAASLLCCDQYGYIMESVGASERVLGYLERPLAPQLAGGDQPGKASGVLQLQDVSFWYPNRNERPALSHINLTLQPGKVTALVGLSGSGKTTLVALLQRLYDPTGGRILLDGRDLRDVDSAWFRGHLGVVSQEPRLFSGDLSYNISYGCPRQVGQDEVEAAARAANAHDFIMALPQGYQTPVTDRLLSGGQRQRIALARALLREPAVLILDEATSALDADSEAAVQAALDAIMAQRSRAMLVVAHRLSTVRNADNIVVLERGQIVEQGSHRELVAAGGIYSRLVARQTGNHGALDLNIKLGSPNPSQALSTPNVDSTRATLPPPASVTELNGASAHTAEKARAGALEQSGGVCCCSVDGSDGSEQALSAAALQSYDNADFILAMGSVRSPAAAAAGGQAAAAEPHQAAAASPPHTPTNHPQQPPVGPASTNGKAAAANGAGAAAADGRAGQDSTSDDSVDGAEGAAGGAGGSKFPSIAQLRHLKDTLAFFPDAPDVLTYQGTVKIHGTNMVVVQPSADAELVVQSRNCTLSLEDDNMGSYKFVYSRLPAFRRLFATLRGRFGAAPEDPVVLSGELAGRGVQRGVGTSLVERFYAVFGLSVAGRPVALEAFADVHLNENRIYHIHQFGTYEMQISKEDPRAVAKVIEELSEAVGTSCPAAKFLGVEGKGEGIVWTCREVSSPRLWFKSKCKEHALASENRIPSPEELAKANDAKANMAFAQQFAEAFVTPARLEQGLQYLAETGVAPAKGHGAFIKWVVQDVLKEEGGKLSKEQAFACEKSIGIRAVTWYKQHLASGAAAAAAV